MVTKMPTGKSRKKWIMQLTVQSPPTPVRTPPKHPLENVPPASRNESRQQTLGGVLAAIAARRQSASGRNDPSKFTDLKRG